MIDWKKHPEAVRVALTYWDEFGKTVAQRVVNRPAQTKTVKDAVEWADAGNEIAGYKVDTLCTLVYCASNGSYHFVSSGSAAGNGSSEYYSVIGTREEFEAYVKEKEFTTALSECAKESEGILKALAEQECEKWTHTYGSFGHKCKVLSVDGEHSWVLTEHGSKVTEYTSSLKPIKPTISENQAASIIEAAEAWGIDPDDCQDYLSRFAVEGGVRDCNF